MTMLRHAVPADVPAIRSLIDASVRGLNAGRYTDAQVEESLVSVFGVDSQLLADGTYYVITDGGAVVAAGGWSRRTTLYGGDQVKRDEADPLLDPATDAARIRAFYVAPTHARRGLARRLYLACEDAAVQAGFHRFQLGATLPGVPLYEALGFRAVERADFAMPSGALLPIIRMERNLPAAVDRTR
ncbi:MAG: GNAT family N-acetyltransferase [Gemmatimonadaceae bacterium]|nr:GNAT family N-acetyltransferase [Gemmatimonadaceae bacterium]